MPVPDSLVTGVRIHSSVDTFLPSGTASVPTSSRRMCGGAASASAELIAASSARRTSVTSRDSVRDPRQQHPALDQPQHRPVEQLPPRVPGLGDPGSDERGHLGLGVGELPVPQQVPDLPSRARRGSAAGPRTASPHVHFCTPSCSATYRITTSGTCTGPESVRNVPSIRTVPHWTDQPSLLCRPAGSAPPPARPRPGRRTAPAPPASDPPRTGHTGPPARQTTTHATRPVTVGEQPATTCRYAQIEADSSPPQPQHPR